MTVPVKQSYRQAVGVALAEARHQDRDLSQVPGPVEGGDDQRDRPVGFRAAVVQPERLADPPGGQVAVHVDGLALHRVRVGGGMPPEGDRDLAEVLVGGAVHVLVALRQHDDPHRWDDVPVQRGELHVASHRQGRPVTAAGAPAERCPADSGDRCLAHCHDLPGSTANGYDYIFSDTICGKLRPGGRMKAARCEEYGGPENVVIREIPGPDVTDGHVLVDVAAAAVNYPDLLFIANKYQVPAPLPFTPGAEFAGRVAAVGEGVTGLSAGDLVYGSVFNGAMAEQVLAPAASLALVPPGLSLTEAAAFRVTYLTAYHALVTAGELRPGQWVVVLGAAGGVGTATVDVAVRLGARVIAAASSPERLKVCAGLGAEAGIDYVHEDLKQRIKEITGDGADLVVDPVGDRWAEPALRAIRWGGRFVTVGYAGGDIPRIPLNIVLLKNITVRGLELRTWTQRLPVETARARQALAELIAGGMRPAVSEVHDLEDLGTALRRVADRVPTGKVVIRVNPLITA
jgi:NADPH:quinone reductase